MPRKQLVWTALPGSQSRTTLSLPALAILAPDLLAQKVCYSQAVCLEVPGQDLLSYLSHMPGKKLSLDLQLLTAVFA